ncbi:MAG: MMPL family transporter [Candidatus Thermoplasmatota archaeon]|nr:MMPL family transporter [Candidatus Thermoplasmatota archaeon]
MPSDDEDSSIRGRIDRFFDKRAKEQQELLRGEIGGKKISESWAEAKQKLGGYSKKGTSKKKSAKSTEKLHKVKESGKKAPKSDSLPEVEISPLARSFVRLTTDYPPITIGVMTAVMLFMLVGIGQTNINGAMEVYLPQGSKEESLLLEVREDWSTDIIVIYVETDNAYDLASPANITNRQVLLEMDYIERTVDEYGQTEKGGAGIVPSDGGLEDNVVWSFSISTLIKELHSTNSRVYDAVIDNAGEWSIARSDGTTTAAAEALAGWATLAKTSGTLNSYEIPTQSDIDDIVQDLPPAIVEKVMRDTNDDGIWDTAVILFGITSEVPPPIIIDEVDEAMNNRGWGLNEEEETAGTRPDGQTFSRMMLTGPVPVTQAITERSFSEFWRIFPIGVVLCAVAIFLIQKKIRAVLISGVPTLYSIFITYGIIGWSGIEATPTIIALGPILMALGVAYGLHLSNRFTEEEGPDAQTRMMKALSTTGKAIALSALTTMIGFGSLMYTNLGPVFTVGLSLTLGILVCLLSTFIMAPALAVLTDYNYRKTEGEWHGLARIVTNHNKPVLAVLLAVSLVSIGLIPALKTNIDYLDMVPNDEPTLEGIVKYSREFNAGAFGMMIARGDFQNDYNQSTEADAVDHLDQIDLLVAGSQDGNRDGLNDVQDVTAISLTEVMKAVKFSTNQSSTLKTLLELVDDVLNLGLDEGFERSFWELLHEDFIASNPAVGRDFQQFLLNVFYDSITPEALSMIMDCAPNETTGVDCKFSKTLIYVDMPLKDIAAMEYAVTGVNEIRDEHEYAPIVVSELTGVAAIGTSVNAQLITSQITTLAICIFLVAFVLSLTFRNIKLGLLTTLPVCWVVALEPLTFVVLGQALSLVTVMIGSIVIGVGIDFSIHITQRVIEGGINMPSIYNATAKTAQTLAEATAVTLVGLTAAFFINISALGWFVFIIVVLLIASMISAMFLLPALYSQIVKSGGTLS